MDWNDLKNDVLKDIDEAVKDFKDQAGEDVSFYKDKMADALVEAAEAFKRGESISDIVKDMDTEATLILSAALSDAGKQQIKLAKSTIGILEQIVWTVLIKVMFQ